MRHVCLVRLLSVFLHSFFVFLSVYFMFKVEVVCYLCSVCTFIQPVFLGGGLYVQFHLSASSPNICFLLWTEAPWRNDPTGYADHSGIIVAPLVFPPPPPTQTRRFEVGTPRSRSLSWRRTSPALALCPSAFPPAGWPPVGPRRTAWVEVGSSKHNKTTRSLVSTTTSKFIKLVFSPCLDIPRACSPTIGVWCPRMADIRELFTVSLALA